MASCGADAAAVVASDRKGPDDPGQWCAMPQASITTVAGGCSARKRASNAGTKMPSTLPMERIAMWLMVGWSLAELFFSLLPILLFHYGVPPDVLWAISSGALALFILGFASAMLRRSDGPTPSSCFPVPDASPRS